MKFLVVYGPFGVFQRVAKFSYIALRLRTLIVLQVRTLSRREGPAIDDY